MNIENKQEKGLSPIVKYAILISSVVLALAILYLMFIASGSLCRVAQGNIAGTNQGQLVNAIKTENALTDKAQNTKVVDSRPLPSPTLKAIESKLGPSATLGSFRTIYC